MEIHNQRGNGAETGSEVSQDYDSVVLEDFSEKGVEGEIEKAASGIGQSQR